MSIFRTFREELQLKQIPHFERKIYAALYDTRNMQHMIMIMTEGFYIVIYDQEGCDDSNVNAAEALKSESLIDPIILECPIYIISNTKLPRSCYHTFQNVKRCHYRLQII